MPRRSKVRPSARRKWADELCTQWGGTGLPVTGDVVGTGPMARGCGTRTQGSDVGGCGRHLGLSSRSDLRHRELAQRGGRRSLSPRVAALNKSPVVAGRPVQLDTYHRALASMRTTDAANSLLSPVSDPSPVGGRSYCRTCPTRVPRIRYSGRMCTSENRSVESVLTMMGCRSDTSSRRGAG